MGNREHSVSYGVKNGNDFTDHVVCRRDRSIIVIGVPDHISWNPH